MTPVSPSPPVCPLAVTMGEPAGIGTEITLKAWVRRSEVAHPFFLLDDYERVLDASLALQIDVPIQKIDNPEDAIKVFDDALPVLHQPCNGNVTLGQPSSGTAKSVISSIEKAVELSLANKAAGVVTNPIQKSVLYQSGFTFPGHTEFLGELSGLTAPPVMMLACEGLRVVPVTVHISLVQAISDLSSAIIVQQAQITQAALHRDFDLKNPRLAIAGLNPHAGEDGSMGIEEETIIVPAINTLKSLGMNVSGPYPPDTLFTERARSRYDAAICMYHDQALIPIKTLDFDGGVNVTLGLPFVRTSPDHGTALEIAGQGKANPQSLLAALKMAGEMAHCRSQTDS